MHVISAESRVESRVTSVESRVESRVIEKMKVRVTSRVASHEGRVTSRVTSHRVKSRVTHESHKLSQKSNHKKWIVGVITTLINNSMRYINMLIGLYQIANLSDSGERLVCINCIYCRPNTPATLTGDDTS